MLNAAFLQLGSSPESFSAAQRVFYGAQDQGGVKLQLS